MTLLAEREAPAPIWWPPATACACWSSLVTIPFALQWSGLHGLDVTPTVRDRELAWLALLACAPGPVPW
jgi:hypothetical protein